MAGARHLNYILDLHPSTRFPLTPQPWPLLRLRGGGQPTGQLPPCPDNNNNSSTEADNNSLSSQGSGANRNTPSRDSSSSSNQGLRPRTWDPLGISFIQPSKPTWPASPRRRSVPLTPRRLFAQPSDPRLTSYFNFVPPNLLLPQFAFQPPPMFNAPVPLTAQTPNLQILAQALIEADIPQQPQQDVLQISIVAAELDLQVPIQQPDTPSASPEPTVSTYEEELRNAAWRILDFLNRDEQHLENQEDKDSLESCVDFLPRKQDPWQPVEEPPTVNVD